MKSFKQHNVQTKIWKALLESSSPRDILLLLENPSNLLKNLIKNHLEDLDDVDRLKEIYRAIAGPVVRQKLVHHLVHYQLNRLELFVQHHIISS